MKDFTRVSSPAAGPSAVMRLFDWISNLVDQALNFIFSLTHRVSVVRANALTVGFFLAWMVAVILVVPVDEGRAQATRLIQAALTVPAEDQPAPNPIALTLEFLFSTFLHPAVLRHLLALYAPYWLMHRLAAIYLADIFGLGRERLHVAEAFVEQAAFGRRYTSIQIREGRVVEEDSIIIQIGGPGIVKVELDSVALFERPDGTPLVIGPTNGTIIDEFVRIRRVLDLRDTIEGADLPPTRSKDGMLIGVKDIQFSYSIYRGENLDRSQMPYPFSKKAVENLVYKDSRTVKPGRPPSNEPEWKSGPFNMKGPILGEMGSFISSRGLGEFLSSIGEPEEQSLRAVEQQIEQHSQLLSGIGGASLREPPLKAGPFTPRTMLTEQFYNQEGFFKRMVERGFQLNWIGVGTWHTPIEVITANHREAWKISRENYARGNPQALRAVRTEAQLQELLRLIQTLPLGIFYKNADAEEDQLIDALLEEYEETLQRAADLFLRGPQSLESRFTKLMEQVRELIGPDRRSFFSSEYENFLREMQSRSQGWRVTDPGIQELLQRAAELNALFGERLTPLDRDFLGRTVALVNDLQVYNRIMTVVRVIRQLRYPGRDLGAMG
ncbi:MAG: hypothetical protein DDG60_10215 [Anaerolineae bacterium]|nr:MAG: hypothetical protein DDG60_10215 [Anaerolineae bacterium]